MFNEFGIVRSVLVYSACVLLVVFLGYMLVTPQSLMTIAVVGLTMVALSFPLMLRWHHWVLITVWNAPLIFFFIPGQPAFWAVMAFASLSFSILHRALRKKTDFIHVGMTSWPLLLLAVIVIITILLTGGIGSRAFGSETWGAKRYLGVLGAIAGYFALVGHRIPLRHANLAATLFFLSGVTAVMADLAFAAGPNFYFVFAFFSSDIASQQAFTQMTFMRLAGLTWMAQAGICFLLVRYGIRGLLNLAYPWRLALFLILFSLGLFGGFRSTVVLTALLLMTQFYYEGLLRSRFLPMVLSVAVLGGVFIVAFVDKMPLSVQRSLSFLPLNVDSAARADAAGSLDWRLQMWKVVVKDVPTYFFKGKGYTFSGTDYVLTQEAQRRGLFTAYEDTLISGNYHQGMLTLCIPFGIWGVIAFIWFCISGWRVLLNNYRYGDPALHRINTFLIGFYMAHLIFYLFFYGQFDLDFMQFTGLVGLSVARNVGVRKPAIELAPLPARGVEVVSLGA